MAAAERFSLEVVNVVVVVSFICFGFIRVRSVS
jgi:hypothetical protein